MPNRTVIGSTITVQGEVEGKEDLIVQGTVKGKVNLTESFFVEPSGVVEADIETQNVEISGKLRGNVEASNRVEIKREGDMVGDIRAPRIVIADGATFKGKVDMVR